MAAEQDIKAPEWVFPGAQVVVVSEGRRGSSVEVETVKNVGKQWVTLEGSSTRFPLGTLKRDRASWDGFSARLVELYSEEGQRWLWRKRRTNVRLGVRAAVKAWEEKPYSAQTRADLRAALDKLDAVIEEGP